MTLHCQVHSLPPGIHCCYCHHHPYLTPSPWSVSQWVFLYIIWLDVSSSLCLSPWVFFICTQREWYNHEVICSVVIFAWMSLETYLTIQCCLMNHLLSCDCLIEKSELVMFLETQPWAISLRVPLIPVTMGFSIWLVSSARDRVWVLKRHPYMIPCIHLHHNLPSMFCDCGCTIYMKHRRLHFCLDVLFLSCVFFSGMHGKHLTTGSSIFIYWCVQVYFKSTGLIYSNLNKSLP